MNRRLLQAYAVGATIVLVGLTAWMMRQAALARQRERALQARLQSMEDAQRRERDKLRRETAEMARLSEALAQARSALAQTTDGANPFEDAVGTWLDQVYRLSTYLGRHPEFSIPELRNVTANDWLDATKGVTLVTEADYRKALATLRAAAKAVVAPKIAGALKGYVAANHGALPPDAQALASYLPDAFDPTILQRYTINPSGQVPNLRGDLRFVLVESKPVDPLWDSTYYFSDTGGYGLHGAYNAYASTVAEAISQYERSNGGAPADASQLAPYLPRKVDPSQLAALFAALTTKPALPAGGTDGK